MSMLRFLNDDGLNESQPYAVIPDFESEEDFPRADELADDAVALMKTLERFAADVEW